ncbi:MAG: vWA domain-containing protein [Planctomycetaceae bacterium]
MLNFAGLRDSKNWSALMISGLVHAVFLGALGLYKISTALDIPVVSVETVIDEERTQEEFTQDMTLDTTTSDNLTTQSGGVVTTNLGSAAATPISQTKIETSEALKDPEVRVVTIGDITIPGVGELNVDLGEGEVSGEVGARVEGYGVAMHRITQELTRMMRQQPVIAVWLFDASNSLKDDRAEIRDNFHKIYEELNIAQKQATQSNQKYAALETMICSFGAGVNELLPKPTAELEAIKKAIDNVKEDESGKEMTFSSIQAMMEKYGNASKRTDRKLVIICLTDETGEDDIKLEEVIDKAERFSVPCYFMGREAIFGYPYAHVRWVDPEFGLAHDIRVDRGPETAFPECLQYNGFGGRWDSASSGFGPYAQVRLAKRSGGIFFMLSTQEQDLIGSAAHLERKFDDLAMKEYEPLLLARREYEASRNQNKFRQTIWEVILALNPHIDSQLGLQWRHYSVDYGDFEQQYQNQLQRGLRAMAKVSQGIEILDSIRKLREEEREPRWRAAYDLCYAQLLSYRVRQFQFLLRLDQHGKDKPLPKDPKHNNWDMRHTQTMLEPDDQQIKNTKVDIKKLEEQRLLALKMFDYVIEQHPRTPWAQRAEQEKQWGFGLDMVSYFHDPKYNDPMYQKRVPKF